MDFELNEEQRMLADTVRRFVDQQYGFEAWKKLAATATGFSEAHWHTLAEMGLTGLVVPQAHGGMGAGPVETLIVMEALGRGLVLEPYLSTAVVGAAMLARAGTKSVKDELLPGVVDGSQRIALAALEAQARFDLWDVQTTAKREGGSYVLSGRKVLVLHGDSAGHLIVSARTSGQSTGRNGISLFVVPVTTGAAAEETPGLTVQGYRNLDGQRSATIELDNVTVCADALLGLQEEGYELLEWGVDRGIAALCSEAVGAASRLFDITAEYLRTRKQFGQPIGRFQALQHRATDMLIGLEHARSITLLAAARVDDPDRMERRKALSAAKAVVGRHIRFIGQEAIQLHGGIGMTDELAVGHYAKRLNCIDMTWGDRAHHTEMYMEDL